MNSKALLKYLRLYTEPTPELDRAAAAGPYDDAVVIPICGEDTYLDGVFESLVRAAESPARKVLTILVVNDGLGDEVHRLDNRAVLSRLPTQSRLSSSVFLQVLDRTGSRSNVGTARKQGSDLAVALATRGLIRSAWIHTTDADARVAQDYFDMRPTTTVPWGLGPLPMGAMVHPFFHETDGELGIAVGMYDAFLRYYSEGLSRAGSPFSYPTIGSTISFTPEAYAQVRGFPKRDAGEDFYFLHKVAKTAFIWTGGGEVRLRCRPSNRVPFGTGRSIAKIQALLSEGAEYEVYPPVVFDALGDWLRQMEKLAEGGTWESATRSLPSVVLEGLEKMGASEEHRRIGADRKGVEEKLRHWHTWFDGFRTLKLIHWVRDRVPQRHTLPIAAISHGPPSPLQPWQ